MSDANNERLAALLDEVPETYERAVQVLAAAHAIGPERVDIYSVPDPEAQAVRLIEVSDTFPEGAVERRVRPNGVERIVPVFPMGRSRDFPFRTEIVQVTPSEWVQIRAGTLKLNRDWGDLRLAREVGHGD